MIRKPGPGVLVAAAFIGPGTVTTCLRAGAESGYSLLWALLLSVVATIVLQEMAGRLGLITRLGLPELIRKRVGHAVGRIAMIGIVFAAVVLGNAAYEAGNIAGAVLGLEAVIGSGWAFYFPWLAGAAAFALLWSGRYKLLEQVFTVLIVLMSLSFLLTAVLVKPELMGIARGLLLPDMNEASWTTALALVGTTVVPYNLFLYTSLVTEKWKETRDALPQMRSDIALSVILGGLVSMAILVTAAGAGITQMGSVGDLAAALEPVYGPAARYGIGIGLLAAGVSSAITAPLAAAYVARQCFGWKADQRDGKFRSVWLLVLLFGIFSLSLDFRPLEVIYFAQIANAILLPGIAVFLWWMSASKKLLGSDRNNKWQNVLTLLILAVVTALAVRSVLSLIYSVQ